MGNSSVSSKQQCQIYLSFILGNKITSSSSNTTLHNKYSWFTRQQTQHDRLLAPIHYIHQCPFNIITGSETKYAFVEYCDMKLLRTY